MGGSVDDAGFTSFVTQHQRTIRAYVRTLGVPWDAVDEVAHESFVQFYLGHARRPADVIEVRWLMSIARHCSLTWFRTRSRASRWRELAELLEQAPIADDAADLRDDAALAALRACVATLPEPSRQVLAWFYADDATADAIAERSGMTGVAIRQKLVRMREALASCIRKRLREEPA